MHALIREFGNFFHTGLPFCHTVREYSPHLITLLLSEMRRRGASPAEVLAGTGISPRSLEGRLDRVSALQILQAVMNGLRFSSAMGLHVGARFGVVACGIYGYAMMSSPDRQHLVDLIEKFAPFIDPLTKVTYKSSTEGTTWQLEPYFSDVPASSLYQFAIETKLSSSLRVGRDLFGESFGFERVRLRYAEPAHSKAYEQILGCPVEFGQPRNEFRYATVDLVPTEIFNPDSTNYQLMLDVCEREVQRLRRYSTLTNTVGKLMQKHAGHPLSIDDVAQNLLLNTRTLRRHLKAEGTTFREIATEQRMSQAAVYLRANKISVDEIATKLGYCDASSFRKAFTAWSGKTPSHFRDNCSDS
jgi:AraC-like DNA-binding protein